MWKSGTFDLDDINKTLIEEIVWFDIRFSNQWVEPGCVIFFTASGDEYIISKHGTEWSVGGIVKFFPEIYEAWISRMNKAKDEYGWITSRNWKVRVSEYKEWMLVRADYFEKFYEYYKNASEHDKIYPCTVARRMFGREPNAQKEIMFGREPNAQKERMVFIKNHEAREKDEQKERERKLEIEQKERERKLEIEQNRLYDSDVPWMKIFEGCMKILIRRNFDSTVSVYRWIIQFQKEQEEDGCYRRNPRIECYNLFLTIYDDLDVKEVEDFENFYNKYVRDHKPGEFHRSYRELDKAKEAVIAKNEKDGWGNVNKKNMYMLDYEHLKARVKYFHSY